MTDLLDQPSSPEDLYLDRGDEIPPWRPVMNGDVFCDVSIPGVEPSPFSMVVAHPCTMRVGAALKPRLRCCPVVKHDDVPLPRWSNGFFRIMPLPQLFADENYALRLDETGMVPVESLRLDKRVACLATRGMLLLLQRMVFNDSRVAVPLGRFHEQIAGVVEEAELLEEWNETLAANRVADGEPQAESLNAEAAAFDALLSEQRSGPSLRDRLAGPDAPAVRRAVRQAIDVRRQ